jgi:hypothetical protein
MEVVVGTPPDNRVGHDADVGDERQRDVGKSVGTRFGPSHRPDVRPRW